MKTKQPILLYRDNAKLLKVIFYEEQKREKLNEIKDVVKTAIGDATINYKDLIVNGIDILVDTYINEFAPHLPKHLNKKVRLEKDTNIDLQQFEKLIAEYNANNLSKPTITDDGELISNIDASFFDMYLDESQREFYETITAFKNILNKVQKENYPYQNYHEIPAMLTKFLTYEAGNFNQGTLRTEMFKTANNGF
jgi:hypothetical protein